MRCSALRIGAACGAICLCWSAAAGAQEVRREDLGRSEKLRIVVDKVMQPTEDWVTKEWMVKEAAEAGFNVFSPRRGHDRLEEVVEVTEWCEKYGIYHMPWMRGTLAAPDGPEADGKRVVWANGSEQPLWSVNSDEFWEWTHQYIVEYARLSAENAHLMGVFLDYENYAPGKQGNLYSLSYDDIIMGKFAEARGIELPELDLVARRGWLEEQGLHEVFSEFQVNHWRERCRRLREAVDEHNPKFQFCIYPAPGTPFMVEATYPEWGTQEAPLILADAGTYGRPSRFLPEAEAVEGNRQRLLNGMKIAQDAGIPFMYSGGIDPVVAGADPEFCGKNAVMISDVTDGYWIFYEGPTYEEDHPEYFKWFAWANKAIAQGNFAAQHAPRETPEDWTLDVFGGAEEGLKVTPPEITGETVEFPLVRMRRENLILLAVKAGEPVKVVLRNHPIAQYKSLLAWDLRNAKMGKVTSGMIPHDQQQAIEFTPDADGLYVLGASAGSCAYSVVSSNVPIGLFTADGLSLIYGAERLYLSVPDGVEAFSITARGTGAETVRVNVLDPDGNQVSTGETTPTEATAEIEVDVGDRGGGVWSLQVDRAAEGTLEDNSIKLSPNLPPVLALSPEHAFGSTQTE
jgi:hypothetical protein